LEKKYSAENVSVTIGGVEMRAAAEFGDPIIGLNDLVFSKSIRSGKAARKFKRQNSTGSGRGHFVNQMTRAERTDFRRGGKIPARLFMRIERDNMIQVNRYLLPENFSRRGNGPIWTGRHPQFIKQSNEMRLDKAVKRAWDRRFTRGYWPFIDDAGQRGQLT
jgi:hypothetical protein